MRATISDSWRSRGPDVFFLFQHFSTTIPDEEHRDIRLMAYFAVDAAKDQISEKKQFPGEDRIIVPSPKDVPTYDYKPEMSAPEVTTKVVENLPKYDLVILNFANPDMVGHTGVVEVGIEAVETIDQCVKAVVEKTLSLGGELLITANHGNCEQMRNPDGSPNTAHTTYLVHFIYVAERAGSFKVDSGILADVAPTLLFLLGLEQPAEMTGRNLVSQRT